MSHATALSDAGLALLEAGQNQEALELLLQARSLAGLDPQVHYRLGLAYSDAGRFAEALASYDESLAIEPANARAHNNRGSCLQVLGGIQEAEAAFRRAIDIEPLLVPPYVNLGHLLEFHDLPAAATLYQEAIALGLDAKVFAHHLAAIQGNTTTRAEDAWVRTTFDNFAPGFDRWLASLGYDAPQRVAAVLGNARSLDILDLGCGTGLVGKELAGGGHRITGIDLSEKMLARAQARGVYGTLHLAEVHDWLDGAPPNSFDLVIAADVFIYIGAVEKAFQGIAGVLRPGGQFILSTEECADDYQLLATGRYAQSHHYIAACASPFFTPVKDEAITLRWEGDAPVPGRLYVFERNAKSEGAGL